MSDTITPPQGDNGQETQPPAQSAVQRPARRIETQTIPLLAGRERIDSALFHGVPNAESYTNSECLQLMLKVLGAKVRNFEEAAQHLLDQPEFKEIREASERRGIMQLRSLLREGNRSRSTRLRRGVSGGFSRSFNIDTDIVDAVIAYANRVMGEKHMTLEFPPRAPEPDLPVPKTLRAYLDRHGDEFMGIFTETLGLDAPPVSNDNLLFTIVQGLSEAGVVSELGKHSRFTTPALLEKCKSFFPDAENNEEKAETYRRLISAMSFTRQASTSALDPLIADMNADDMRLFSEMVRDKAPKLCAQLKHQIQVGNTNWTLKDKTHFYADTANIKLVRTGADASVVPLRTNIPFTEENIALLMRTIHDEMEALRANGEPVTDRVELNKIRAGIAAVEAQVIVR